MNFDKIDQLHYAINGIWVVDIEIVTSYSIVTTLTKHH